MMAKPHNERHKLNNSGWLRAAVLGANDGIVSTSSLILGVAAAHSTHHNIMITGAAGLVAGAMSMATGEYISVSSQQDTEKAALELERKEVADDPQSEHKELALIYEHRGLTRELAAQVAEQLMVHDAIGAHIRDELGLTESLKARPIQASLASACSFAIGAVLPLIVVSLAPDSLLTPAVAIASLVFLGLLGGIAAKIGGAAPFRGVVRVMFWSALAMLATAGIGALFGATPS
ncbi:VIT family protein [soil metagenome]